VSSGSQAKRQRRKTEAALTASILDAHNALHDDDVDACHEALHAALGVGDEPTGSERGERLSRFGDFDEGYRRLCQRTGVVAAYLAVGEGGRAVCGGNADVARYIKQALDGAS
jgi:hypothetical protein